MKHQGARKLAVALCVAALVVAFPVGADEIKGKIKLIDRAKSEMVVIDAKTEKEVTVNLGSLSRSGIGKSDELKGLKEGTHVSVTSSLIASRITVDDDKVAAVEQPMTLLQEFWYNFTHNLFKPLLLFFYLGFLVPILKVELEFPYAIYQGLTIYLLLAIGWHGGEELARKLDWESARSLLGFLAVGFATNFIVGIMANLALKMLCPRMRRVDQATVAGYYGSDSAGTFVTCLGVLTTAHIAFDAYMPVMLAVMEIPGCLVALCLVSRLRMLGMDALGNMPDEEGYNPSAKSPEPHTTRSSQPPLTKHDQDIEKELELSLEKMTTREFEATGPVADDQKTTGVFRGKLLHEVFLNTGLYLLFGGILIGLISGAQGEAVTRDDDNFFNTLFQGILCLFLLEMGMTASRKLRDLKAGGPGFIAFALIGPNVFATFGICIVHAYAYVSGTPLQLGSYVLFSVLCAAASYIAVPAVQRLAIPEASPTLPLAASLGLTFSYNVTIGIPLYIVIAKQVMRAFPI